MTRELAGWQARRSVAAPNTEPGPQELTTYQTYHASRHMSGWA